MACIVILSSTLSFNIVVSGLFLLNIGSSFDLLARILREWDPFRSMSIPGLLRIIDLLASASWLGCRILVCFQLVTFTPVFLHF